MTPKPLRRKIVHENAWAVSRLRNQFPDEKFIAEICEGERGYGRYKFKVLSQEGFPTHHTDRIEDAREWLDWCRLCWAGIIK